MMMMMMVMMVMVMMMMIPTWLLCRWLGTNIHGNWEGLTLAYAMLMLMLA